MTSQSQPMRRVGAGNPYPGTPPANTSRLVPGTRWCRLRQWIDADQVHFLQVDRRLPLAACVGCPEREPSEARRACKARYAGRVGMISDVRPFLKMDILRAKLAVSGACCGPGSRSHRASQAVDLADAQMDKIERLLGQADLANGLGHAEHGLQGIGNDRHRASHARRLGSLRWAAYAPSRP
jgi:hypothetical protein